MNRLKSIFISLSVALWAYFSFLTIQLIVDSGVSFFAIGLILDSFLPLGFFLLLLSVRPFARTTRYLYLITTLVSLGVVITLVGVFQQMFPMIHLSMALAGAVLWFIYVYWYSVMPERTNELKKGAILPELTFTEGKTGKISTSSFKGKKVLYMFYRGNWCPLCVAQIREISAQYNELANRGVEVLLISPQTVWHTMRLAKKMKVKFHFLTDEKNAMARKLKIDHDHGTPLGMEIFGFKSETVLPTVIITDEEGVIIYVDQTDNYRVRPEPDTFLSILDSQ